ncbi:hypothetical protein R1sor_014465 [Riccia sorocarpa]|uniref:Peroxidase n=1 Tax=Riccia sorocarpa TaxID=122646 RepID=A0ABD3HBC8_9MARC
MGRFAGGAQMRYLALFALVVTATILSAAVPARAQLKPDFYAKSCPKLFFIVFQKVDAAIKKEARMAGSLLRLHFHDCFVQGCDGGILLDDDPRLPLGEKTAAANRNSARGFEVIDDIKGAVEAECPKTVSCADIVTLAAFWSVNLTGGPIWIPPLGRRDGLTANFTAAGEFLPSPFATNSGLKDAFKKVGLGVTDLVALSGAHTLGFARCAVHGVRLYNFNGTGKPDPTIDNGLLSSLQKVCPQGGDGNVTFPLDPTFAKFDNLYFKELLGLRGTLNSDEVLFTQASDTKGLVQTYAKNQTRFFNDFVASMIRMGNIKPKTGKDGEIRLKCRKPNSLLLEDADPLIQLVTDA